MEALISSDKDLLLELMRTALEEVLKAEMTEQLGASPGERSDGRARQLKRLVDAR